MDRRNNMRAFERGVRSLLDAGLQARIDLIVGLPGDTAETVRDGLRFVRDSGLYTDVQVFNLAVLPGTAFRDEAAALGLEFQPRPPYYVLRTPTLRHEEILALMAEAEDFFDTEFDALPAPRLEIDPQPGDPPGLVRGWVLDFDVPATQRAELVAASRRAQAFTLWLRGADLATATSACVTAVRRVLADNPHTTLQVVLEPTGDPRRIGTEFVERLLEACYAAPTYLDRFYAVSPGALKGTKRIVVVLPAAARARAGSRWIAALGDCATLVWRGGAIEAASLDAHEHVLPR
jgi:hypothetical protein